MLSPATQFVGYHIIQPNGSAVTNWADDGTGGNDATSNPATGAPTLLTNALNGKSAVAFDGTQSMLSNKSISQLCTIVVVGAMDLIEGTYQRFFDGTSDNDHRVLFGQQGVVDGDGHGQVALYAGSIVAADEDFPTGYHIWTVIVNGANSALYRDGLLIASGDAGASSTLGLSIGAGHFDGNYTEFLNGRIAELRIYDSAANQTDRQTFEHELSVTYGITVTATATAPRNNISICVGVGIW